MKKTKGLMLIVTVLTVAMLSFASGFTTRANAAPAESNAEQAEIQPRFGGKSYAMIPFTDANKFGTNGLRLWVKIYAENYVLGLSDKGHVYVYATYYYHNQEWPFEPNGEISIHISMTYEWKNGDGVAPDVRDFTIRYHDDWNTDNLTPETFPYRDFEPYHISSKAKNFSGNGKGASSCLAIRVDVTATYPGGFTAEAKGMRATF